MASGIALEKNLDNGLQVMNDWKNLILSRTSSSKREKKILVGLPTIHRPTIWLEMSGTFALINSHPQTYNTLSKQLNEYEEFIQQDVTRTIFEEGVDLESFTVRLANILRAYSNYNTVIGYRQGLNFICAVLLLTIQDEESCFWMLVQIMEHYQLSLFYLQNTTFHKLMKRFEEKLESIEPEVYAHIKSVIEDLWIFPCMWLSPMLANSSCTRANLERLWDIFFVTSLDFLFYVGLSLISLRSRNILQIESYMLCEYLKTIPSGLTDQDVNFIIVHSLRLYTKTSPDMILKEVL